MPGSGLHEADQSGLSAGPGCSSTAAVALTYQQRMPCAHATMRWLGSSAATMPVPAMCLPTITASLPCPVLQLTVLTNGFPHTCTALLTCSVFLCCAGLRCAVLLQGVELSPTDDPNVIFDRHQRAGCDPSNYARVHKKPRCPVKGCKEKLTSINTYTCKDCRTAVCLRHRLADDHACAGAKAGSAAAAAAGGSCSCL